jgi:NTP pyrophosphatase (non-canonical NTP hydrolase)
LGERLTTEYRSPKRTARPAVKGRVMNLNDIQEAAYANAVRKGFTDPDNPDIAWEISLLHAEVSEAFEAWRKEPDKVGGELADVIIFAAKIGRIMGADLNAEVERKLRVNEARTYTRNEHGNLVKCTDSGREGDAR